MPGKFKLRLFTLLIAGAIPFLTGAQSPFARDLWRQYQSATQFEAKKEAFRRLSGYYHSYHVDSCILICQDFIRYAEKKHPDYVPYIKTRLANSYIRKVDYETAGKILYPLLEMAEKKQDDTLRATVLLSLSNLASAQKNIPLSIQRAAESEVIFQRLKRWRDLCASYTILGNDYRSTSTDTGMMYYQKILDIARQNNLDDVQGVTLLNMGAQFHVQGKVDQAIQYYKDAAELFQKKDDRYSLCFALLNIGHAFKKIKHWDEAIPWFDKALPICESCGNTEGIGSIYMGKVTVLKEKGDFKGALEAQEKFSDVENLLNDQIKNRNTLELEAKYQNEKKEEELNHQKNQQRYILAISFLLILLVSSFLLYQQKRLKARRKEAELLAQLEHSEAQKLRDLDKMKSTFFANISHEFRTPLTLIISPLEQMESGTFTGEPRKYYAIMRRNAQRLMNLVNQLLDLSKMESGKLQLLPTDDDLAQKLRLFAYAFESLAVKKQIHFSAELPASPLLVRLDFRRLGDVINNLLSNAFKFTKEGGNVHISAKVDHNALHLAVQDSGIGIPPDQLQHIFERFFQVSSQESADQAGTGIGLTYTKELVELQGGTIRAESTEGQGTTFRIQIPLQLQTSAPAPEKMEIIHSPENGNLPQQTIAKRETSTAPVVLVVEDHADLRTYIADQLQDKYRVVLAENGRIGLDLATEHTPDLIVTDIMMPEMNGQELTERLKNDERTSHIPVIMLTAKADQSDKIEGLTTGADAYLTKPFDARELLATINNLIELRRRLHERFSKEVRFKPAEVLETSLDDKFLHRVREAIEANMDDEQFGVENLARQVALSRSQLHRKLQALTGKGPNEIIRQMRLERAKSLLEQGAGTISEIAFRVGFNSPAYFSTCFSEQYGYPPTSLKKSEKNG